MEKIPTCFERGDDHKVSTTWREDCLWVRDGAGVATEKLDGTNVRVIVSIDDSEAEGVVRMVTLDKRRNPSKAEKAEGAQPGYVAADRSDPADKHIWRAFDNTDLSDWPEGVFNCEAIGPKIQGNPLGLEVPILVPFHGVMPVDTDADIARGQAWQDEHALPAWDSMPRSWGELRMMFVAPGGLPSLFSPGREAEGIVFHHPSGAMAKIKARDFR